jgi:uncharacterized protein (UPF0276 family)
MASPPAVGWLEVHSENYMCGGPARRCLEKIRRERPISLHGVGLSLGSPWLNERHLDRLAELVVAIEPMLVSEHLAWSRWNGHYLNDLLPLPYTDEALAVVGRNVDRLQRRLKRQVLVENPARYARFADSTIDEAAFLAALSRGTGCGVLLDLNNLYVNCRNLGGEPERYLDALPADAVSEIHLAGHAAVEVDEATVLIDDHGSKVAPPVWALYLQAAARFPWAETLIEWDSRLPELETLVEQASLAARCHALAGLGIQRAAA